jgi:transposase
MSDGITDAYRGIVTTTFSSKNEFRCSECNGRTATRTCWTDQHGQYHQCCDDCAKELGVL